MREKHRETVAYQVYPRYNLDRTYLNPLEVMIAVKYPKYLEVHEQANGLTPVRVFFTLPETVLYCKDRAQFSSCVRYDDSVHGFVLTPQGQDWCQNGYHGFCLSDHLNRPVEYAITQPTMYVNTMGLPYLPVPISELAEAIEDLSGMQELCTMYKTPEALILQRLCTHNLCFPDNPVYPPQDFLEDMYKRVCSRTLSLVHASRLIGLTPEKLGARFQD